MNKPLRNGLIGGAAIGAIAKFGMKKSTKVSAIAGAVGFGLVYYLTYRMQPEVYDQEDAPDLPADKSPARSSKATTGKSSKNSGGSGAVLTAEERQILESSGVEYGPGTQILP